MPDLIVRATTLGDFEEFARVVHAAFLEEFVEREEWIRRRFARDRSHVVLDGGPDGELIGTCAILGRRLTLPGTGPTPVAAVTAVAVKPGHRRRGVLTTMMRTQLHGLHADGGEPVAALWASEAPIYGRFGYAPAAHYQRVDVPSEQPFRPGVELGEHRVRQLPREQAVPLLEPIHRAAAAAVPGGLSRDELEWNMYLSDVPEERDGASPLRFAVHPQGYAVFRTRRGWDDRGPSSHIHVHELVARTPTATAALWRHLLDYDLIGTVHANLPLDDPLPLLLLDRRQAVAQLRDSLWIRLVDLDRALPQRRYAAPLDVVLEVADAFCPWNAGRWRLVVDDEGRAGVQRTGDQADLELDVADLAAAFLGGPSLLQQAGTGRVRERTAGALLAASRAFGWSRLPHCPEVF